jgi:hypothetical protein
MTANGSVTGSHLLHPLPLYPHTGISIYTSVHCVRKGRIDALAAAILDRPARPSPEAGPRDASTESI